MSSIQVYIPRILGSVTKTEIIDVFKRMDIGKVTNIDMVSKINEKKNKYHYAFIKIELYSTVRSVNFKNSIRKHGMIRLLYDEEAAQYWEIKLKVERSERINAVEYKNIPFYRYITLGENTNPPSKVLNENIRPPYNMWNTPIMLPDKIIDL
jgi:hypothetical protein